MTTEQPQPTNEDAGVASAVERAVRPSRFLAAGFPYCSIFGESWHESTAVVYLEALVAFGDEWRELTSDQVKTAMARVKSREPGVVSILADSSRISMVSKELSCADDAARFSYVWRKVVPNEQT